MGKSKVRVFTVVPLSMGGRPFVVAARNRVQLQRRLLEALLCSEFAAAEFVSALWKDRPVFVLDVGISLIPGRFESVSHQVMGASRGLGV